MRYIAAVAIFSVLATAALAQPAGPTSKRPRIVIHPRIPTIVEPPPTAKRYCRSWLEKENRASGPVIVPRMQCWWG